MPKQAKAMDNRVYDFFKYVAQIVLPAIGTLYFALAQIWGLPAADEVVGTIVAVDAFLGVLLGISSARYHGSDQRYDGVMEIAQSESGQKVFHLNLHHDQPEDLINRREIRFKVDPTEVTSTPGDLPPVPPV